MAVRHRRRSDAQKGQMLVAVIVLLGLLFFVGTAMALAVSASLHTLSLAQATDFTDYAAESAVAVEAALVQTSGVPASVAKAAVGAAGSPCPSGSLSPGRTINAQATGATACYVSAVANPRIWAIPPTTLSKLSDSVVVSFPCPTAAGAATWGVIGWHSPTGKTAAIQVAIDPGGCADLDASCAPSQVMTNQLPAAKVAESPGLLYFQCGVPANVSGFGSGTFSLDISCSNCPKRSVKNGVKAYLTDFNVREADGGTECVATVIGQARHVVDEADWLLPGGSGGCGWTGATQILWNGALP